jgi:hypothetical protein
MKKQPDFYNLDHKVGYFKAHEKPASIAKNMNPDRYQPSWALQNIDQGAAPVSMA